jgi:NADH-quinone oxidoreductase subunit I
LPPAPRSILLADFAKGFRLGSILLRAKGATLNYPYVVRLAELSASRGEHALRRYPNGEERCIVVIV